MTSGSGMEKKSRSGFITDLISENLVSVFRVKNFLMRIRDLPGSGMEKSLIRDKLFGSATLIKLYHGTMAGIRQEWERQAGTQRAEHESDP